MGDPVTAMVLAAGFGTRMGKLTQDRPKPLIEVAGRPLIDHALSYLTEAGIGRVVVNLHYLPNQIRAHLQHRSGPEILFSEEQPEILDTGGGIVQALPMLGNGPFVTLNSDAVFIGPNPVTHLLRSWQPADMDALMLFVPIGAAMAYTRAGDFFLDDRSGVPKRRGDQTKAPFVFTGAQIIKVDCFQDVPAGAFSTNVIWDRLMASDSLSAISYPGRWIDIGTPDGIARAEDELRRWDER